MMPRQSSDSSVDRPDDNFAVRNVICAYITIVFSSLVFFICITLTVVLTLYKYPLVWTLLAYVICMSCLYLANFASSIHMLCGKNRGGLPERRRRTELRRSCQYPITMLVEDGIVEETVHRQPPRIRSELQLDISLRSPIHRHHKTPPPPYEDISYGQNGNSEDSVDRTKALQIAENTAHLLARASIEAKRRRRNSRHVDETSLDGESQRNPLALETSTEKSQNSSTSSTDAIDTTVKLIMDNPEEVMPRKICAASADQIEFPIPGHRDQQLRENLMIFRQNSHTAQLLARASVESERRKLNNRHSLETSINGELNRNPLDFGTSIQRSQNSLTSSTNGVDTVIRLTMDKLDDGTLAKSCIASAGQIKFPKPDNRDVQHGGKLMSPKRNNNAEQLLAKASVEIGRCSSNVKYSIGTPFDRELNRNTLESGTSIAVSRNLSTLTVNVPDEETSETSYTESADSTEFLVQTSKSVQQRENIFLPMQNAQDEVFISELEMDESEHRARITIPELVTTASQSNSIIRNSEISIKEHPKSKRKISPAKIHKALTSETNIWTTVDQNDEKKQDVLWVRLPQDPCRLRNENVQLNIVESRPLRKTMTDPSAAYSAPSLQHQLQNSTGVEPQSCGTESFPHARLLGTVSEGSCVYQNMNPEEWMKAWKRGVSEMSSKNSSRTFGVRL